MFTLIPCARDENEMLCLVELNVGYDLSGIGLSCLGQGGVVGLSVFEVVVCLSLLDVKDFLLTSSSLVALGSVIRGFLSVLLLKKESVRVFCCFFCGFLFVETDVGVLWFRS